MKDLSHGEDKHTTPSARGECSALAFSQNEISYQAVGRSLYIIRKNYTYKIQYLQEIKPTNSQHITVLQIGFTRN